MARDNSEEFTLAQAALFNWKNKDYPAIAPSLAGLLTLGLAEPNSLSLRSALTVMDGLISVGEVGITVHTISSCLAACKSIPDIVKNDVSCRLIKAGDVAFEQSDMRVAAIAYADAVNLGGYCQDASLYDKLDSVAHAAELQSPPDFHAAIDARKPRSSLYLMSICVRAEDAGDVEAAIYGYTEVLSSGGSHCRDGGRAADRLVEIGFSPDNGRHTEAVLSGLSNNEMISHIAEFFKRAVAEEKWLHATQAVHHITQQKMRDEFYLDFKDEFDLTDSLRIYGDRVAGTCLRRADAGQADADQWKAAYVALRILAYRPSHQDAALYKLAELGNTMFDGHRSGLGNVSTIFQTIVDACVVSENAGLRPPVADYAGRMLTLVNRKLDGKPLITDFECCAAYAENSHFDLGRAIKESLLVPEQAPLIKAGGGCLPPRI